MLRAIALILLPLSVLAASNPDELLEKVQSKLRAMMRGLPRYTCVQTVERQYFKRAEHKGAAPSCDQIMGERKTGRNKAQLFATDRLRLDVAVASGREIVSWVGAGKFDARTVDEVVGEGPTGTGAFGGHILDVFTNAGTRFLYQGEKIVNGKTLLEYHFTVPRDASNYRIHGTEGWHITAYDGSFLIDPQALQLERLDLRTGELTPDTNMCEASTGLEYQHLRIGEGEFILPKQSQLRIVDRDDQESVNVTTFASCREYHTESTIHFDGEAEELKASATQSSAALKPLPEGLSLSLVLTTRIDTSSAAAGDQVSARVARTVREPKSKVTLIPAGAVVHGRIARMLHRVGSTDDFVVLISFDALEINGMAAPLFVKLDSVAQLERTRLLSPSRRLPAGALNQGPQTWGALIFPARDGRYVIPSGYESEWLTVAPPQPKN